MVMQLGGSKHSSKQSSKLNIGEVGIVGAGPAGMLAALACQPYATSIRIFEKNPERASGRKPQPHLEYGYAVVSGGLEAVRGLSRSLFEELISGGAGFGDALANVRFCEGDTISPSVASDLSILTASRGYIVRTIRSHLDRFSNISIERSVVGEVLAAGERAAIVAGEDRWLFDLVIDASGRRPEGRRPFDAAFYDKKRPEVERYDPAVLIRNVILKEQEFDLANWLLLLGNVAPPDGQFGSQIMRLENGSVQIAVAERECSSGSRVAAEKILRASFPPSYADLAVSGIQGRALSSQHYRHAYKTRYPFDGHPDKFLTIGDAMMSTNPVYGLGISCAAIAAFNLRTAIERSLELNDATQIVPLYHASSRTTAEFAWQVSRWTDVCYSDDKGSLSSVQKLLRPFRNMIIADPAACKLLFAGTALITEHSFGKVLAKAIFLAVVGKAERWLNAFFTEAGIHRLPGENHQPIVNSDKGPSADAKN